MKLVTIKIRVSIKYIKRKIYFKMTHNYSSIWHDMNHFVTSILHFGVPFQVMTK